MTPGKVRVEKSRSNSTYQNYEASQKNSETPWKNTHAGTDFGVISEEEKNDPKLYFWDYDGHRKLRQPKDFQKFMDVNPIGSADLQQRSNKSVKLKPVDDSSGQEAPRGSALKYKKNDIPSALSGDLDTQRKMSLVKS